ncbi:hypothetical protein [Roseateles sp.]|uniref:hypothetical protein n=1 Tax=Roseateles sp. TaxID=1971397 RepID=UPI0032638F7B
MDAQMVEHALVTAAFVGGLQWLMKRGGPRLGGWVAAVPVTSAPALFWLSLERGGGWAAEAATAALVSTGLTAVFALVYGRGCARRCPAACTALALLACVTLGAVVQPQLAGGLVASSLFAFATMVWARRGLPCVDAAQQRRAAADPQRDRRNCCMVMVVAGTLTLLTGLVGGAAGPTICGLLAAVPIVGICTIVSTHRRDGAARTGALLKAYVQGSLAKAFFLVGLAAGLTALPVAWAWPTALLVMGMALAGQQLAPRLWASRRATPL